MKATDTFRTPPYCHNCAQAVAYKYCGLMGLDTQQALARFAACGTGKAPGGVCGALYAAMQARPGSAGRILELFKERTGGYVTCADIKGRGRVPCPECVPAADDILASLANEAE